MSAVYGNRADAIGYLRSAACQFNLGNVDAGMSFINDAEKCSPEDVYAVYKKTWELCGSPTLESHPNIAHNEYGRLAFRSTDINDLRYTAPSLKGRAIHSYEKDFVTFQQMTNGTASVKNKATVEENLTELTKLLGQFAEECPEQMPTSSEKFSALMRTNPEQVPGLTTKAKELLAQIKVIWDKIPAEARAEVIKVVIAEGWKFIKDKAQTLCTIL